MTALVQEINNYDTYVRPMVGNIYFNDNHLDILLRHMFPSYSKVHTYGKKRLIIKCKVLDLIQSKPNIVNWFRNRAPDIDRCKEIASFIYNEKDTEHISTMFYMNYNNKSGKMEIFDGIHRYTALNILYNANIKPFDGLEAMTEQYNYGHGFDARQVFENYVLVYIMVNSSEGEVSNQFMNLNKAQPVADMYMRDVEEEKKKLIELIATSWQQKYKTHFSTNKSFRKPHTNRDTFVSLLDSIYDKYHCANDETQKLLSDKLNEANERIKNDYNNGKIKASFEATWKCRTTGCYLFLLTKEELIEFI